MKRPDMIGNKFAVGNKPNKTSFKKGQRPSPNTEFKKGIIPYSKLHPEICQRGEEHHAWKGGRERFRCIDCNRIISYLRKRCIKCNAKTQIGKKRKPHTEEAKQKMREAKKGKVSPLKGKKFKHRQDGNSYQYKGENAGYSAIHKWVRKRRGEPTKCEHCGKEKKCQWANKDHLYRRRLKDYISLCARCHKLYDNKSS